MLHLEIYWILDLAIRLVLRLEIHWEMLIRGRFGLTVQQTVAMKAKESENQWEH